MAKKTEHNWQIADIAGKIMKIDYCTGETWILTGLKWVKIEG